MNDTLYGYSVLNTFFVTTSKETAAGRACTHIHLVGFQVASGSFLLVTLSSSIETQFATEFQPRTVAVNCSQERELSASLSHTQSIGLLALLPITVPLSYTSCLFLSSRLGSFSG